MEPDSRMYGKTEVEYDDRGIVTGSVRQEGWEWSLCGSTEFRVPKRWTIKKVDRGLYKRTKSRSGVST